MAPRNGTKGTEPHPDRPALGQLLAENVDALLWLFDYENGLVHVNAAYEALTGRSRASLAEKPRSWWDNVDPTHRPALRRDLAAEKRFERTVRVFREDGSERWVRLCGRPVVDERGATTHFAGTGEDVTEQHEAERVSREERETFRIVAENVSDLISRHALDGRVLYASPSIEAVLGYSPHDSLTEPPRDWILPEDFANWARHARELFRSTEPRTFEFRVKHQDGSDRWLQSSCRMLRDADGNPREILAVSRDVTEQRRAAAALAESEERFRQLAESIHQVFWLYDVDARQVVYVSPAYERIWGHGIEAIHDHSRHWIDSVHPEDRRRVWGEFKEKAARGDFDVEYRVMRPNGDLRWIHDRGFPIRNATGQVYRIAGIAEDVTEAKRAHEALRESEARFRQLAEHVGGMFWLCDWETGEVIYRTRRLEGFPEDDTIQETPMAWLDDVHPEDREIAAQGIAELAREGSFESNYRLIREDGEVLWTRTRGFAIRDASGAIVRTAGWTEDVTENRRLQTRVQQTQKLESLGVLAGGIAHDFNNLLTGVLGNASLALEEVPPDAPLRGMVQEIDQAARRAAALCTQMLAYAGRAELALEPVDLGEVVRSIAPLLRTSLRGIATTYTFGEDLPHTRGDASQLGQIVLNLMTNAAEAVEGGAGEIHVRVGVCHADADTLRESYLEETPPAGEYVFLQVEDSGCGMSLETQRKIFEPFFSTKFTGRGLGLAAVLGIVRGHGGAVFLESEPGRGTVFRVLLPVFHPEGSTENTDATRPRLEDAAPEGERERGTVLLVDDEPMVLKLVARIAEGAGYRTLRAASGREALEIHAERGAEIRAVLLDWTMPGLSGEDVLRALQETSPGLPVLLMSGFAENEFHETAGGLGHAGFVRKPFSSAELIEALDRAIPRDGSNFGGEGR